MSRVDQIDTASLRARLVWALQVPGDGSLYLLTIGACYLCCSTAEEEERLEELYFSQAAEEQVDADDVLSAIILAAGEVLS